VLLHKRIQSGNLISDIQKSNTNQSFENYRRINQKWQSHQGDYGKFPTQNEHKDQNENNPENITDDVDNTTG
jgi:hypothetical protein